MIDTNITQYASSIAGFNNDNVITFSASYAGGSIGVGAYVGPISASAALTNANDVSQIQVNIGGLESFYRLLLGVFQVNYPTTGTATYSIECFSYFTGGNVHVDSYIINQSGSSVTIPALSFNCSASTFASPF